MIKPLKTVNLGPVLKLIGALIAGGLAGAGGASQLAPEPVCPPCAVAPVEAPKAPAEVVPAPPVAPVVVPI